MADVETVPDVGLTWTILYDSALSGSSLLSAYGSDTDDDENSRSASMKSFTAESPAEYNIYDNEKTKNLTSPKSSAIPAPRADKNRSRRRKPDHEPQANNLNNNNRKVLDECDTPNRALTDREVQDIDQWTRRKTLYIPCVYTSQINPGSASYCGSWNCNSYASIVQQAPYSYIYFLGSLTAGDRIIGLEPVPTSRFNIFYACSRLGNVICFEARADALLKNAASPKCELIIHDRFNCGIGRVLRMRVGTMLIAFETVCRTLTSRGFTDEEKIEIFLFTHGGLRVAVVTHDYPPSVMPVTDFGFTCCNSLVIASNGKVFEQSSDTWSFICKRSRVKFECRGKHHSLINAATAHAWTDVTASAGMSRCCLALHTTRIGWQLVDTCSLLSSGPINLEPSNCGDIDFEIKECRLLDDDCQTFLTWDNDSIHISSVDEANRANRTKYSVRNTEVLEAVNASIECTSVRKKKTNGNVVKAGGINGILTWITVIEDGQIWCSIMC